MIHIAICDDSLADSECIEEQLLQLQPRFSEKLEITIFYSGESFCSTIKENCPFDIILMDIEMENIDGIMAGQHLRSNDENDMVLLLYISNHEGYFRQLFDVQPFAFIQKPISNQEFSLKLEKAIQKAVNRRKTGKRKVLPISQNGREILIPFKNIFFLESKIRKVWLHTKDGLREYYGTLNSEEPKLDSNKFVRTHQSYIVNLRYIKEISSDTLTLVNNTAIPISNSRRASVKNSYMEYRRNYFE